MRRERETQIFLCWLLLHHQLSTQPMRGACSTQSSGLAQVWISTLLFRGRNSTHCFFSNLSPHFQCMTSLTSLVPISIWDFYFDISEWHILSGCTWTPALMLPLTNPCAKRKVLSLTEPKGKIYKTKFLRNYITKTSVIHYFSLFSKCN